METDPMLKCKAKITNKNLGGTTNRVSVNCGECPNTQFVAWASGETSVSANAAAFRDAERYLVGICPKFRQDKIHLDNQQG